MEISDCENWLDMKIPSINSNYHNLIPSIRRIYYNHLKEVIDNNYYLWCGKKPDNDLIQATYLLELEAAAKALIVPLYRENLVSLINDIKQHSNEKKLYPKLNKEVIQKQIQNVGVQINLGSSSIKSTKDAATQVDPEYFGSESNHDYEFVDDEISKQLDELFNNDEEDIFGDLIKNNVPKPDNVSVLPNFDSINQSVSADLNNFNTDCEINLEYAAQPENTEINDIFTHSNEIVDKPIEQINSCNEKKYVYSKWPCELHFRRKKLCETLVNICEKDWKKHSKVKKRFVDLFGEDSDDELEQILPNTSKEFLRSCRTRISPMVVHHAGNYFKRYKLPKELFKPLVNKFLYKIVEINQYPSDYEVFQYVRMFIKNRSFMKDFIQSTRNQPVIK